MSHQTDEKDAPTTTAESTRTLKHHVGHATMTATQRPPSTLSEHSMEYSTLPTPGRTVRALLSHRRTTVASSISGLEKECARLIVAALSAYTNASASRSWRMLVIACRASLAVMTG